MCKIKIHPGVDDAYDEEFSASLKNCNIRKKMLLTEQCFTILYIGMQILMDICHNTKDKHFI